jgi:hypothetical protein
VGGQPKTPIVASIVYRPAGSGVFELPAKFSLLVQLVQVNNGDIFPPIRSQFIVDVFDGMIAVTVAVFDFLKEPK